MFRRREVVVSAGIVALLAALLGDRPEWWRENEPFGRTHDIQAAVAFTPDEEINIRVYRAASPAVVNITTIAVAYDFFLNPMPKEGTGSGAIIDRSGHILTNFHVIDGARRLEVTLADGSKWPARPVGADPSNDLAVIRIDAPVEKLTVIPLEILQINCRPEGLGHRQPIRIGSDPDSRHCQLRGTIDPSR